LCLPPRLIKVRNDQLDNQENDFYEALYTQSKTRFMAFVEEGTVLNNYAHVFDLLLRLRQAVDHPYLVLHAKDRDSDKGSEWCVVCQEPCDDPLISKCKHSFCRPCAETYSQNSVDGNAKCPECHKSLTIDLRQKSKSALTPKKDKTILQRVDLTNWRTSTKIEALMEELTKIKDGNGNAKSLVFSQFVNFLDLIEWRLKLAGFNCVKLDGRMRVDQKNFVIDKFNNDADTTIFLISLKAGGIALNLTVASNCFLMDPWWNPAAEFQAIDRIYRLGQYKCISVTRFIIPDSIEERIMQLQEKKHLLFNSTVGNDADALARLSVDDLKFLFH